MAQVLNGNQIKLNSGKVVQAQQGAWFDGSQFWGGSLSQPGQINTQSNQQGAGQAVSQEVIQQTNPANVAYINAQRQQAGLTPSPTVSTPTSTPTQTTPSDTGTPSTSSTSGAGLGVTTPETINLPQLYEGLYASSGIRNTEADLNSKTMAFNEQVAKIKDNPYLSEATMTGRISKLESKFNADKLAITNDIATKKADIETQLNLQTKQFDINSTAAKNALDQFNSLLSAGALDGANGEDIANFTRSTGISSSMINSAINANKAKNVKTETIKWDDGTNQGFAVVNSNTGEIINKQTIAASAPTAAETKAALGGGTTTSTTKQIAADKAAAPSQATQDAKNRMTLGTMMALYLQYGLTKQKIYDIYKNNTPYAQNAGTKSNDKKRYGVK